MHGIDIARGVDHRAAPGFAGRDGEKPVAQALMKSAIEPLEPIGGRRAQRGAAQTLINRQVKDQCQVRCKIAERETLQRC